MCVCVFGMFAFSCKRKVDSSKRFYSVRVYLVQFDSIVPSISAERLKWWGKRRKAKREGNGRGLGHVNVIQWQEWSRTTRAISSRGRIRSTTSATAVVDAACCRLFPIIGVDKSYCRSLGAIRCFVCVWVLVFVSSSIGAIKTIGVNCCYDCNVQFAYFFLFLIPLAISCFSVFLVSLLQFCYFGLLSILDSSLFYSFFFLLLIFFIWHY